MAQGGVGDGIRKRTCALCGGSNGQSTLGDERSVTVLEYIPLVQQRGIFVCQILDAAGEF